MVWKAVVGVLPCRRPFLDCHAAQPAAAHDADGDDDDEDDVG